MIYLLLTFIMRTMHGLSATHIHNGNHVRFNEPRCVRDEMT